MSIIKALRPSFIRSGFKTLALFLFAGAAASQTPQNVPVPQFDLAHYLGRWYEIARLPLFF